MQDIQSRLKALHRPKLLMRAARIGARTYRRERHLARLLEARVPSRPGQAILHLLESEVMLNAQRLEDCSEYNLLRHVDVMIALVAEAQLFEAQCAAQA